jgi:hypothetical protein
MLLVFSLFSWIASITYSITANPGRRKTYNAGQKHKTRRNFTFYDNRIEKNFKLEKFLQPRGGCMCGITVMSGNEMDPYYGSSVTRDVSDESAWRWSHMSTETCSNYHIKPMWAVRLVYFTVLTAKYTTGCKQWTRLLHVWAQPRETACDSLWSPLDHSSVRYELKPLMISELCLMKLITSLN